jgi:hypothetical protein
MSDAATFQKCFALRIETSNWVVYYHLFFSEKAAKRFLWEYVAINRGKALGAEEDADAAVEAYFEGGGSWEIEEVEVHHEPRVLKSGDTFELGFVLEAKCVVGKTHQVILVRRTGLAESTPQPYVVWWYDPERGSCYSGRYFAPENLGSAAACFSTTGQPDAQARGEERTKQHGRRGTRRS